MVISGTSCKRSVSQLLKEPKLDQATPGDIGRWVDRACNAALNLQRIGKAPCRPLELCRSSYTSPPSPTFTTTYPPHYSSFHYKAAPAKGKEYPALGFKKLRGRAPKAQAQQPVPQ
ncbi:hypothetical protein QJQ45_025566 [Haematococcus lacustris]|nr:hypothetical protein QJQ45_025566 [Haematococcus lacustris]